MATGLQAVGALAISIGAGLIFAPAGLIIGGAFVVAFGIALERNAR